MIQFRLFIRLVLTAGFILFSTVAFCIEIPLQLRRNDLNDIVQMLGYNTACKLLTNPFPLGGFSGFEVGYSTEFINLTDFSRLGAGSDQKSTFQFNRITFGKGLYNDVDLFLHFVPFSNSNEITEYGIQLKWTFYQAAYLPFSLSILGSYNDINFQDTYLNEILGWDLVGGLNLDSFAIYIGGGTQRAQSTFNQSNLDLSDPELPLNGSKTFVIKSSQMHSFVGMNIDLAPLFLAAQIDRYEQPVYSVKLGLRY